MKKKKDAKEDINVYEVERELERGDKEEMDEYVKRWLPKYRQLSDFYNSLTFKKRRLFLKRASQGEFDRALNGFLSACGTNISKKHSDSKFIFIFGDADFGHGTWSSFTDYAVPKLKSLGHYVVFENEWGTSKLSPCCHQVLEKVSGDAKGTRIKYCRGCHIYYHRDTMAGQNIIYTWQYALENNGQRPKEYSFAFQQKEQEKKKEQGNLEKKRKRKGKEVRDYDESGMFFSNLT